MRPALLLLVSALVLAPSAAGQSDRFSGWERMEAPDWTFDPDDRAILGFSVRAATSARSAVEDAEDALAAGAVEEAARILLDAVARHGTHVIQVDGGARPEDARWVGAGEWALHLLTSRVGPSILRELASPEDREGVATATVWRDLSALRRLTWDLDGLPEGSAAGGVLARLLAERGQWEAADVAARRVLAAEGDDERLRRLRELLAPAEGPAAVEATLPERLEPQWPTAPFRTPWRPLAIAELCDRGNRSNPFSGPYGTVEAPFAPVRPVVDEGVVFVADSISVTAWDLLSGRRLWHHAGPLEVLEDLPGRTRWFDLGVYANRRRRRAISPYQCAWPVLTDHLVVATVQVAERYHELDEFEGYPINHPLPWRRLRAIDRDTGALHWIQERPSRSEEAFVNRFDVAGPPVVHGDVVYASGSVTEGAINAYLAAFDLGTGNLLWRTLLCAGQQELTMFNRPFQEHVVSPPVLHEGTLFVSTNLGVVGAVDAWSGRIRWLTAYETIARGGSRSVRPDTARDVYWLNRPPFVEDGVLVVAPVDSYWLSGLHPATGRRLWDVRTSSSHLSRSRRHQAVPTGRGLVVVATDDGLEAYDAGRGHAVWPQRDLPDGREIVGAVTRFGDRLLVPCEDDLVAVDLASGGVIASRSWPSRGDDVQCVVAGDGALVMVTGESLTAALDEEAVRASAAGTPREALVSAEMALVARRFDEARAAFDAVLHAGDPALATRARTGRLEAALGRAWTEGSAEAWNLVMEMAEPAAQRFRLAPEALAALLRLGADEDVARWLADLADHDPRRLLDLGSDGPLPVGLHAARAALDGQDPSGRLATLHRLIGDHPDERWDGVRVEEEARRRIDALLLRHGRGLYAPYEAAAREALAAGDELARVAARYPNAEVVAEARVARMEALLDEGRALEVLEATRGAPVAALVARRAEAARALGETTLAAALAGEAPGRDDRLPRLPRGPAEVLDFALSDTRRVLFRAPTGHAAPDHEGLVVGVVEGLGEMLALDTRAGAVRWEGRALPGRSSTLTGKVHFHLDSDLLVVRGRDTIEAMTADDGMTLWSRSLAAVVGDVVMVDGLVLVVIESDDEIRVEAYGMRTGVMVFRLALPECRTAQMREVGGHVVVLTKGWYGVDGARDVRLITLDVARGTIGSVTELDEDLSLVNVAHEPPTVLLATRWGGGSRLAAWDAAAADWRWESTVDASHLIHDQLMPVAPGRLVLRTPASMPGADRLRVDRLVPIDLVRGVAGDDFGPPRLKVVDPQEGRQPRLVTTDPGLDERLVVLDGATGDERLVWDYDRPLPTGGLRVVHGEDGFVLLASFLDPLSTDLWVVHDDDPGRRYSIELDDLRRNGRFEVVLVDEAVLVSTGGTVRLIRSSRR